MFRLAPGRESQHLLPPLAAASAEEPRMNSWQPQQTAPGRGSGSPLLAVNFLPVTYTADKFPADMIPFESPEQLGELRAKLDGTHVVTRAGGQIACVPLSADSPAAGRRTELDVRDDRRIAAHLVEAALVRDVLAPRYKLRRLGPPQFVNRARDLFQEAARAAGAELDGVQVSPAVLSQRPRIRPGRRFRDHPGDQDALRDQPAGKRADPPWDARRRALHPRRS